MVRVLTAIFCVCVMLGSILMVVVAAYLMDATKDDDAILNLNNIKLSFSTIVLDKNGDPYQTLSGDEHRIWVELDQMPDNLTNAFIAVEDNTFLKHSGVNWKRSFASLINEVIPIFDNRQGGSTITQQLVKNLTMDDKQDAMRKLREMYRAMLLEKQYSKDLIMEAYLNTLRLTGQNAGVESGANVYFGKHVEDLTLEECASLAAITKNPSAYSPFTNPEDHLTRRNYILGLMKNQGFITEEEYNTAVATPLNLSDGTGLSNRGATNSYFTDVVIDEVINDLMAELGMSKAEATDLLYNGGLRIYSTVDPELQTIMEAEMLNEDGVFPEKTHIVEKTDEDGNTYEEEVPAQAAMISLTYDGSIAAVVGGLGEKEGDRVFNRATDAVRPNGSTMKPIGAYVLGIEFNYITYSSPFLDNYVKEIYDPALGRTRQWPRNYSGSYTEADVLVYDALARSLNTIAVRAGEQVGARQIYDFLSGTLHVTSLVGSGSSNDIDLGPMVLGSLTEGISPKELAGAYMMFGNGGYYSTIHSYTKVLDSSGNVILEKKIVTTQAISSETSYIMNRMLYNVLHGGTANGLYPSRVAAVGKTGTTSDDVDHWFVGLTPDFVTATWWGYDEQDTLRVNYRTHPPTTAWRNVMNAYYADIPANEINTFPVDSNVEIHAFCTESGDLAGPGCPGQANGYYKKERIPGTCFLHN